MVLSNSERQARYKQKLREAAEMNSAYEIDILRQQVAALEQALNETRRSLNLPEVQLKKSAHAPRG